MVMMATQTQGKKRLNTPTHSGWRSGGSSWAAATGRSIWWAKNIPPTQITAARRCRGMAILMGVLSLGSGVWLWFCARFGNVAFEPALNMAYQQGFLMSIGVVGGGDSQLAIAKF